MTHTDKMASRTQRRVICIALVLFLLVGLVIVDHRPHRAREHSKLYTSIQEMMLPELRAHPQSAKTGHLLGKTRDMKTGKQLKEDDSQEGLKLEACTTINPTKGFIDLRDLSSYRLEGQVQPWLSKDYENETNFTLGICLSPVKKSLLSSAVFKDSVNASEVGAYYIDPETQQHVLMGQFSGKPVFKGRKLTMTYENGSYCDSLVSVDGLRIRRSTILTFTCDREMLNKAHISYIASFQDCAYMFEVRSHYACPTATKADNLAAIWIFLLILLAALLVYFSGSLIINFLKVKTPAYSPLHDK